MLRLQHNKKDANRQYHVADDVSVGSVVMTRDCLDVGLVAKVCNGKPIQVFARDSAYSSKNGVLPQYGGVDAVTWYDTGIHMSIRDWVHLSQSTDADGCYKYWCAKLHIKD